MTERTLNIEKLVKDNILKISPEGDVQILRLPKCGKCGHRHIHIPNERCIKQWEELCSCCPMTWPTTQDVLKYVDELMKGSNHDTD